MSTKREFGRVGHILSGKHPYVSDCTFMVLGPIPQHPTDDRYRVVSVIEGRGYLGHVAVRPGEIGSVRMDSKDVTWLDDPQP